MHSYTRVDHNNYSGASAVEVITLQLIVSEQALNQPVGIQLRENNALQFSDN